MDKPQFYDYKVGDYWHILTEGLIWEVILINQNTNEPYDPDKFLYEDGKMAKVPYKIYESTLRAIEKLLKERIIKHSKLIELIEEYQKRIEVKCVSIGEIKASEDCEQIDSISKKYKMLYLNVCGETALDELIKTLEHDVKENMNMLKMIKTNLQVKSFEKSELEARNVI